MTDTPQQRCTLCDCERIPLDREKTRFGACTNIQCEDPTLDYRNEQSTLPELLEKARHHVMTDEEKEAQRQSWVRGETGMDEGVTRISRGGAQPEPDGWHEAFVKWAVADGMQTDYMLSHANRIRDGFIAGWKARAGSSPAPGPLPDTTFTFEERSILWQILRKAKGANIEIAWGNEQVKAVEEKILPTTYSTVTGNEGKICRITGAENRKKAH